MGRIGLHCLLVSSDFRGPQSLNQNRGETVSYDRNMIIEVNRGFGLGDRNKTIKASLRLHTGPHCKG
jgi:hypothetical protein